jgi:hypothetical protein
VEATLKNKTNCFNFANNDEVIGDLIATAFGKGKEGVIT